MARTKRKMQSPGYDGNVLIDASVRITRTRWESRVIRCRPGTFEWRYGRKTGNSALYHAGIQFATLWERAGTASDSSPDLRRTGSGQWKGLPDVKLDAMDAIDEAREHIGRPGTALLVDYCVMGTPSSEIAEKYGMEDRAMSHVLEHHLTAAAQHFRLIR